MKTNRKIRVSKLYYIGIPIFIFGIVTVYTAIEAASAGAKIAVLEEKENELRRRNQDLSRNLVEATSLTDLSGKTEELGFIKPGNIVYIQTKDSVAELIRN